MMEKKEQKNSKKKKALAVVLAAQQIRPNMTIVKDPQIKNIGKSDSYNFIMFTVPFDRFAVFGTFGEKEKIII